MADDRAVGGAARKGDLPEDPRGLLFEAYRMEMDAPMARAVFLDWQLGLPAGIDPRAALEAAWAHYGDRAHPMTEVLREGLEAPVRPRGRRGRRA